MISGRTRRRLTEAAAWLLAALIACPAPAAEGAGGWGMAQLMAEFGKVKRSQARFTERKYLKVLKAPLLSSGTLTYTAPDKLEKRTLKPRPEVLLVEGGQVVVELDAGARRTLKMADYPVLQAFVESIRATLGGDAATLERYYKVSLEGDRAGWQLYLAPRSRDMARVISQIRIGGGNGRIDLIEVQETRGDRSVMKVTEDGP
jgi:hypothetical protein